MSADAQKYMVKYLLPMSYGDAKMTTSKDKEVRSGRVWPLFDSVLLFFI